MSTEQVILNLDNIEIKEKVIEFQKEEYKIKRTTVKEAAIFLSKLEKEKNLNIIYVELIKFVCPDILEKTDDMLEEHKEALACVLFKEGFNIEIKESFKKIQEIKEKENYVKKKLK